jgi:hypothetical protein
VKNLGKGGKDIEEIIIKHCTSGNKFPISKPVINQGVE